LGGTRRRAAEASQTLINKSAWEEVQESATAASIYSVMKRVEILGDVSPASYQHAALSAR
jgi:hypothetical protein